jgi:hypothetical protein
MNVRLNFIIMARVEIDLVHRLEAQTIGFVTNGDLKD